MLTISHNTATGYNDYPMLYSTADLCQDDFFKKNIKSTYGTRPSSTAKYSRASVESRGTSPGFHKISTAGRPATGSLSRPMTSVRGAGYTSASRRSADSNASFEFEQEETPERKIKKYKRKIMALLEESAMAAYVKNIKIALKRAKEAVSLKRSLIVFEDSAELSDNHNMRLTFAVIYNLAQQYEAQKLYREAIIEYRKIIDNKIFGETARLKVNIGNIYVKMGNLTEAKKMYQMALDQTPLTYKYTRRKIVYNIGILLVQTGKLDEAAQKFEWVMREKPDLESGMQLILCYFALSRVDGMKRGFLELLDVPFPINIDSEYSIMTDDITINIFNDTIKNDELSKFERELKIKAEKTILSTANLIAPVIEETLAQGYAWCAQAIKSSAYTSLAVNLEINKAMIHLHNGQVQTAITALQNFEHEDMNSNSSASIVLSFINFLREDYIAAEKYSEIAKSVDKSNPAAYVNLAACAIAKNELIRAENLLLSALKRDPNHVQGLYNLGLVYKKKDMLDEAFKCFSKVTRITQNDPLTIYQLGHICQLHGDVEQADKRYNQLIALKLIDPGVLKKLGEMYDNISDKQQAYYYYSESYRAYPANFEVIYWLRSHCMSTKNFSGALEYSLKGVDLTLGQPEWRLLFADCLKKSGEINEALAEYRDINKMFPNNINCLKSLCELERSLGSKDAKKYSTELKRLLQLHSNGAGMKMSKTSKIGLSRSNSIVSSVSRLSTASGKKTSPVFCNEENYFSYGVSRPNSSHFTIGPKYYDKNYTDSFEALLTRPMISIGRRDDNFGDDELGDDLLPQ
ncbi:intraflagellar transport protein 88 homolog [Phymastichus coffea]|uniref:intraflagellar transport protein 88 homolog n=1 Tax=Phymastichus coffea TaxID=108790 RepID=UPI00273C5A59|nr:intraflagellar transport protein 88 homolog [Phymastichus coffea]